MNLRKIKKQFKQESGFLFGEHDQIAFIRRTSKLYEHDSPKFPHRKWANIKYREIKTETYWGDIDEQELQKELNFNWFLNKSPI